MNDGAILGLIDQCGMAATGVAFAHLGDAAAARRAAADAFVAALAEARWLRDPSLMPRVICRLARKKALRVARSAAAKKINLTSVSVKGRECMVLRSLGLSYERIAFLLGIPKRGVQKEMYAARIAVLSGGGFAGSRQFDGLMNEDCGFVLKSILLMKAPL